MRDGAGDDDIVELGRADRGGRGFGQRLFGERFRLPDGWRPARGASILAATALVVGLCAGYAAGHGSGTRPTRVGASATAPLSLDPTTLFSLELTQGAGACSVQSGRHLTLGVQVTNQSTVPVTLESVKAVLPLGGLTEVSWRWAPCGAIPQTLAGHEVDILQPGDSTWLTMLFSVQHGCPAPLPVQFTIGYLATGHSVTANLPGFPDLTQVPYTGCP
jgi:hypothetical protein